MSRNFNVVAGVGDPGEDRPRRDRLQKRSYNMSADTHKRLKRLGRLFIDQPLYFITTCVNDRKSILSSDSVENILFDEWRQALDRHGWAIGRYVIMPDHVHFFCRAVADAKGSLSDFIGRWKQWTSKRIISLLGVAAPFWQEGFFDHVLRSEESYSEKWLYVMNNPVRAGLVQNAEEWKYQGYVDFL